MAEISFELNQEQGFRLEKDFEGRAGWLFNLAIGGQKITADLPVIDETGKFYSGDVVAVLAAFTWSGVAGDPIQIKAQISLKNRFALKRLLSKGASVQCELRILQYDPSGSDWFWPLESDALNATLKEAAVNDDPGSVQNPLNYELDFTVAPSGINKLTYATGSGMSVVKFWSGPAGK